jgi:hypothetical protein
MKYYDCKRAICAFRLLLFQYLVSELQYYRLLRFSTCLMSFFSYVGRRLARKIRGQGSLEAPPPQACPGQKSLVDF